MLAKAILHFVGDLDKLAAYLLRLKQLLCPFCGASETLNCHSKLYGNDPASGGNQKIQRGQRVWCCPRGARGGCGRSFSIFLGGVLPGHTVNAPGLWALLERLLRGATVKSALEALKRRVGLETIYHLLQRMRQRLPTIRSVLCQEQQAPASSQTDPLLQTVEHWRQLFPQSDCPCAAFQLHFQRPLLE
jgi:hypothetical protein